MTEQELRTELEQLRQERDALRQKLGHMATDIEQEFYATAGRVLAARLALQAKPKDPMASQDMTEAYMFFCGMACVILEVGFPGLDKRTVEAMKAWASEAARESEVAIPIHQA